MSITTVNMPEIQTPNFFHIRANSTNYIEFSDDRLRASDTNGLTRTLRIEGDLNVNGDVTGTNFIGPMSQAYGAFDIPSNVTMPNASARLIV